MNEQALVPYQAEQINLIKQTVAKGVTDLELKLFLYQAQRTGLDPLSKQIHAIKRWNKSLNREEMAIQTGIDGYRLIADRTEKYAGSDDPLFEENNAGELIKATVTVWKLVNGMKCSFSASARWSEYYPGDKQGFMWKSKPFLMLGKCAEALALRKAFPQELSGVYTHEEMYQAGEAITDKNEPGSSVDNQNQGEKEEKKSPSSLVPTGTPLQQTLEPRSKKPTLQERRLKIISDLKALNYTSDDISNLCLIKVGTVKTSTWGENEVAILEAEVKMLQPPEES